MKLYWLILFSLCSTVSQSQVLISLLFGDKLNSGKIEFGLEGGLSLATLEGIEPMKTQANYNLGFYFDIKTKNPSWMISTGVKVKSTLGAEGISVYSLHDPDLDSAFTGGSIARKLNYFNVPVMLKHTFKNKIYAQGGIQLGLRYKATDVFTNTVSDQDDLTYKLDIKDKYHPLDAGAIAGIGYRLERGNGMNLSFSYYVGLVDVRISDSGPNEFNRAFYLNAGIPIGKGKAMAKQEHQE